MNNQDNSVNDLNKSSNNVSSNEPNNTSSTVKQDLNNSNNKKDTSNNPNKNQNKKELNILILGHTGVGKSTWINGIVNYLSYKNIKKAQNNEVKIIIPTKFTVTDENYEECCIQIGEDQNEMTDLNQNGSSATQEPKTYMFETEEYKIRLIDTPGIGDTRGFEQDKENMDKIISHISEYDYLHGICVLIKPNESRLDVMFRFCINELLTHLHKNAAQNIIFCFTNARSTFYKPGDTLPILRRLISDMKVNIKLNKDTIYCLDNEAFRFLCTLKYDIKYSDNDYKSFSESWDRSVNETTRIFHHVAKLPQHPIKDTTTLNGARNLIIHVTKPLADVSKTIQMNIAVINEEKYKIKNSKKQHKGLAKRLYIPQVVLETKELDYPTTVCTDKDCVKYHRMGLITQTEYVTQCHENCSVQGVTPEIVPNHLIQHCRALRSNVNECVICKHSWDKHMHIRYNQIQNVTTIKDENVDYQMNENKSYKEKLVEHLKTLSKRVKDYKKEEKKIMEISAKFGHFLKENAIRPYNDCLDDYLTYLINEEENKVNKTNADRKTLEGLRHTQEAYHKEVQIIQDAMDRGDAYNITSEDINNLLLELYDLPLSGEQLEQCVNISFITQEKMTNNGDNMLSVYIPAKEEVDESTNLFQRGFSFIVKGIRLLQNRWQ